MRKAKLTTTLTLAVVLFASTFASAQLLPLAPTAIPQFVQELPRLGVDIPVTFGQEFRDAGGNLIRRDVDVSMCEFQAEILPIGTPIGNVPAATPPKTWVWGYEASAGCPDPPVVTHPYIGPVVLATRGTPTQMTYWNQLGDAATSNVAAYRLSTDQTLQWADPFSLQRDGSFLNPFPGIPYVNGFPENNDCNLAVKEFHNGLLAVLPAPCLNNYGFLGPQLPPPAPPAASYAAPVPAAPHLHGGEIPAFLDGGPDAWWTPDGIYGHGYYSKNGVADAAQGKAVYTYPNVQDAAPTWFHDHVLGATRLNVYAGVAGAYYQIDPNLSLPAGMTAAGLANGPGGGEELLIPLVIQDRMFDNAGELVFPAVGLNPEHPFWVPEFVGDTIVVNGKAWPKVTLQPKRYRFLVLNGSNARTYELFLVNPVSKLMGPPIWVIGNDQGYLEKPVMIDPNAAANNKLVVMPGERYEIIIDFGRYAGTAALPTRLQLRNTAKTPYPGGAVVGGNTTGRIVEFQVGAPTGVADAGYDPASGIAIRTPLVRLANPAGTIQAGTTVTKRRQLTLNEVITLLGPIEILMNNTTYTGEESAAKRSQWFQDFTDVPSEWNITRYSEQPVEGETELWEIVNLTADAHPIHPHLVAFQVLNRQAFDLPKYTAFYNSLFPSTPGIYDPGFGPPCDYTVGCPAPVVKKPPVLPPGTLVGGNPDVTYFLKGPVKPPVPAEIGWKDTAISYPGEVLRMLIRFAPTGLANTTPAANAYYEFSPAEGHGYVWHCHIIDHEDNEMMRPFNVIANPNATRTFVKQDPATPDIIGY